ncbi:sensor histidine kinase [Planococcus sp. SIMBA_160]
MTSKLWGFKNYRLRTKLIVTYVLLTVIPMSLLGYIAYSQYSASIEEQVGEYIPKILAQANENISNQIREFSNLPDQLYNSDQMVGILRKDSYQNQSSMLQDEFTFNNYLSRNFINGESSDILGVFVLSKNRIFQSTKIPYSNFEGTDYKDIYGQEIELGGEEKFLLPHQTSLQFEGNPPFILLMKQLTDLENRTNLGTVLIAVDIAFLENVIKNLNEEGKAKLWMMDEDGRIIYHTNPELIRSIDSLAVDYPKINGSFRTTKEEQNRLISLNYLDGTGWILAHSIVAENLTERTDLVRNATIIIFIVFVLISTVISILLAWNVSSPLHRLTNSMKNVEKGNFDVDLSITTTDEVGILANNFTSMVTEIKELVRKNYQIELKQKEAELYALQSQINPHFMYNTLETIVMSVEEDEKDTVVEMVTLLGRMLRYSISNKEDIVPISDELAHIKDYLRIQKIRFEDKFDFVIHEEKNALRFYTPKFILQPLVENAVKYGMKSGQDGKLEVSVEWLQQANGSYVIVFKVRDNGPGIKPESLEKIQLMLADDPMIKKDSHFGLLNVHARVAMNFGSEYGVKISSLVGEGTEVEIKIPVLVGGSEESQNEIRKN